MKKIIKMTILLNLVISLLFVYASYSLWDHFNGNNAAHTSLISSTWNPLTITTTLHKVTDNGMLTTMTTFFTNYNFPFWLFWVMILTNLGIIYSLAKTQEGKEKSSPTNTTVN
jgi:hypothetical protein